MIRLISGATAIATAVAAAPVLMRKPIVYLAKNPFAQSELAQHLRQSLDTYYRTYGACLEGRGDTIK